MRRFPIVSLFLLVLTFSFAQEKTLSLNVKNVPLISVLDQLESTFDVKFSYSDATVSEVKISLESDEETLTQIIGKMDKRTPLLFEKISNRNIIIRTNELVLSGMEGENVLHEVVIRNYLTKGLQKQIDASFYFSPEDFDILPGITEPDILQTLQLLPGIVSPNENATEIFVRGGTPDQNLIFWDGIKIYHSGHLFGSISAFNPYVTDKIQFINKGTNAKYGDRVSSVIDMKTSNEISNDFKGGFGFNLMEVDTYLDIPILKNKLNSILSVRRSLTDIFHTEIYEKLSDKTYQNVVTNPILEGDDRLTFFDFSIKQNLKISDNNKLGFSVIYIENKLETNIDDEDIYTKERLETENVGYNLHWNKIWGSNLSHDFNVYSSNYQLSLLQKNSALNDNSFQKNNDVIDTGFNLNFAYNLRGNHKIFAGYQFSNNHVSYSFAASDRMEEKFENNDHLNTNTLFTSYSYRNGKLFDLTTGMRMSIYSKINELSLEPRLNIFKKLSSDFGLNLTAERKTQAVSRVSEAIERNLLLEDQIWIIANEDQIPLIKSMQFTGGITYSKNNWVVDVDAYFKELEGVTTLNNKIVNMDSYDIKKGENYIKGIDFHLKKQFSDFKTWMSYTLSSVENHFKELNKGQSFPSNSDIRQNLYWSNEFDYRNFKFALGWRWYTGKPYSKADRLVEDENGIGKIEYEGINNYRLPDYHRLDLSGSYNFDIVKSENVKGKFGLSVLNILNRKNILNRSYYLNPSSNTIRSLDTRSLERVVNVVFRLNW